MVFISNRKLHDDDDEISTSTRGLCILYIALIARKLSNLMMAAIGRNM